MVPNKTRFSHSYGGAVHQYAEVTGDSEATRMSYSMAVVEDEIRLRFEPRQRIERRQAARGRQTGPEYREIPRGVAPLPT